MVTFKVDFDRAEKLEEAVKEDTRLIVVCVLMSTGTGILLLLLAPVIPLLYNTTDSVRHIAVSLLTVNAVMMPVYAFTNCCYFTLRSGGKTGITFVFDSVYLWVLCVPLAFALSRLTDMPILYMFIAVQLLDIVKCVLGFILVRRRKWVENLVG